MVVVLMACTKQVKVETPQAPHAFSIEPIEKIMIFKDAEDAKLLCENNLKHVERLRAEILSVSDKRTQSNTLERMNEMLIVYNRILGLTELMANVHPDADVRKAAEDCETKAMASYNATKIDTELYAAIKAVDTSKLDPEAKRFAELILLEYRLSGVDKDPETRKKLEVLSAEMVKSSLDFGRNIRDSKPTLRVRPERLIGLPQDFIDGHPVEEDGLVTLKSDYVDYFPVLSYAKDESLRAEMGKMFTSRAYPENEVLFKRYLDQRYAYAQLLGFDSWASYNSADKMAKNSATIEKFISDIAEATRSRAELEVSEFLALKRLENPEAEAFMPWDRFYYAEQIKRTKHSVDAQEVRLYFPFERVKRGLLNVTSQLYGVTFQQSDRDVWADTVEAYDMFDGDTLIAKFYLDMHPRDGKYGHAAMFGMYNGIEGLQLPAATLVCNFAAPTPSNPAYMEHKDVVTFFHEFGHLLHQLLSGKQHWVNQSGISTEWDFVEAPSQLFEEWAWDYDVLKLFAVNAEGKVIDADLVKRMNESDSVGKGVSNMRQVSYAALSFYYHNGNPSELDLLATQRDVFKKYSPFNAYDEDRTFASFGHLDGYSSMYYTYMWSLAIAKDFAKTFHEKGLLNGDLARKYRKTILAPGGSKPADQLIHDFLGREYNLDAFKAWLAE